MYSTRGTLMFSDDTMFASKSIRANFRGIDIFCRENRGLLHEFLFFWGATICAYLSIIFSRYPHTEDYVRNVLGYSCGQHGRVITALLECLFHFSSLVFDISPFNHILSCAALAYGAVILKKTFVRENALNFLLLCFLPAAVNIYLAADMLFKYDSFYMVLAILSTVLAAYFTANNRRNSV
ncbi:MAG: glucosyltransferase domain-containing protein, partial [Holosporaceae bacterium]|nr:glucosyltransferase domain-containing protein [Holosporaceae bacterium]